MASPPGSGEPGVIALSHTLLPDFPAPWDIPLQDLVGNALTNLCLIEVE